MQQQTRITLKGLKVAGFASQETLCFQAQVYFDGKLIGQAENDGRGGQTMIHATRAEHTHASHADLYRAAEAYAKSLPPTIVKDGELGQKGDFTIESTLDGLVDNLAHEADHLKRVDASYRRATKKKILFTKGGTSEIWNVKATYSPETAAKVMARHPDAVILNALPEAQALRIFREANPS